MSFAIASTATPSTHTMRWRQSATWLVVFGIFAIHAGWPVPDYNEAHYLSKAKHFWDPDGIAHDVFLNSADVHAPFYVACGWLTKWLSLDAFVWLGRVLTWGLLAWAWTRLARALALGGLAAAISAGLFVVFNGRLNLSGEWVVGGFEAKGFSYVFVLLTCEALVRGRWQRVGPLAGAATLLHPIVGGWTSLIAAIVWLFESPPQRISPRGTLRFAPATQFDGKQADPSTVQASWQQKPALHSLRGGILAWCGLAVIGLWPALAADWGVPAGIRSAANQIYVFRRLTHHLVMTEFARSNWLWFSSLLVLWVLISLSVPTDAWRRLRRIVWTSIGIAFVGVLIDVVLLGREQAAASLLRFYWFRMADVMVPLGAAFTLVRIGFQNSGRRTLGGSLCALAVMLIVFGHLAVRTWQIAQLPLPRAEHARNEPELADWRAACGWIDRNLPQEAVFVTPRMAQTFKWHAARAEVATWKDIPQDARSIVSWWQRINDLYIGRDALGRRYWRSADELSVNELAGVSQRYGASYLVTAAEPRLALRLVYRNNSYAVYLLPE